MNSLDRAMMELHAIDREACADGWMQAMHPVAKLLVTLVYLVVLLSYGKYDLFGVLSMGLVLVGMFFLAGVSVHHMGRRMWPMLLLVGLVGIANPFFDHRPLWMVWGITVTGGWVSMATLMLKGMLSMTAAYMLIVTTPMEDICHALRYLHVPAVMVTVVMLVYRYLMVLLKETARLRDAYSMRAPGQKGIHFRVWGSMVGLLLLRSVDRSQMVYESMLLRGFEGEFLPRSKQAARLADYLYTLAGVVLSVLIRCI